MSKSENDPQRKKVYEAESSVGQGKGFYSVKGMQKYINNIVKSEWFKKNFDIDHVQVYEQKKASYACAFIPCPRIGAIWIPKKMFKELTVLHELSHIVTSLNVPYHGTLFVSNYIKLVKEYMGKKKAIQISERFKTYNVRWKR